MRLDFNRLIGYAIVYSISFGLWALILVFIYKIIAWIGAS